MKKNNNSSDGTLRSQAEAKLSGKDEKKNQLPMQDVDILRLLHELQVHQIELEMQNEQLLHAQAEVTAGRQHYENLYNELYDFAPVGYFTLTRDGTIQRANLTSARMLGIERGKLTRQRFETFVSIENQFIFHEMLNKVFADHSKKILETPLLKGNNEIFWAHLEAVIEDDQRAECRIVMVDVTERKQAEMALQTSTEFTNSLIASMQDGLSVVDTNGVHLDVNSALCRMTGFSREDLIGRGTPHPYWPPEEYGHIQDVFQKTVNNEIANFELTFMRKNGERFPVIVSPSAIKDNLGHTIGYSATVKDITERKQMETTLQQRKEELELSNIQQAEHLRKLYESDVERTEKRRLQMALDLHDIVLNQLAILRLSVDDAHVTQNFEGAYDQVTRRLREIVTDLRPPMLSYGLKLAIEGLADNMMDRNKETHNVSFDLQIERDTRYAENIERYLFRIVQEACENALRHSRATQINIHADLLPESVNILIEDNGKGFQTGGPIDLNDLLTHKHFGLVGMMERALLIEAKVEINSMPGTGTQIKIQWNNIPKES